MLLDHTIRFPEVPERPPWDHQHMLGRRKDYWRRVAKALWLVSSGFSFVPEIRHLLAADEKTNPRSGAMLRLVPRLVKTGILRSRLVYLDRRRVMRLVALGENSHRLLQRLGWEPVENEWERLVRLHQKGKQGEEQHTLSVIAFAFHARLRGFQAGVVPELENAGRFAPDAVVVQNGERIFVEVERSYKYGEKWGQMVDYQGFVAFCARTEKQRKRLVSAIRYNIGGSGLATDLYTLFFAHWAENPGPLWLEKW